MATINLAEEQFSEARDFPEWKGGSKVLIIASTPRCGSHMLGHALHATGCFGFPLEYAQPGNLMRWRKRLGTKGLEETLHGIRRLRTSPNGVFGIKIHYGHLREFGGFARVKALFPDAYYVLLTREDALKQAVSYEIASQTGVWISGQKTETKPRYDFERIDRRLRQTVRDNAAWRYVLAANGCRVLQMNYGAAASDLPGAVLEVARFMGVEVPPGKIPTRSATQRQESPLNAEWAKRYLEEGGRRDLWNRGFTLARLRRGVGGRLKRLVKRLGALRAPAAAVVLMALGVSAGLCDPVPGDGDSVFLEETEGRPA
jgi:LPS sulfotransferase NodH